MPLAYDILPDRQTARISGSGDVGFGDLTTLMDRLMADALFQPGYCVLADFSRLAYAPSMLEIRELSRIFRNARHAFSGRVAFVVHNPVQLKMGRFAAALAAMIRFELAAFPTENDALQWLCSGKDITMDELKERIARILGTSRLAALATVTEGGRPWVRYVTIRATDDLTIRFATPLSSRKIGQIRRHPAVHLTCGGTGPANTEAWVQVEGEARVSTDATDRKLVWNNSLKAYFSGPDDPELAVVVIRPVHIEWMTMWSMTPEVLTV